MLVIDQEPIEHKLNEGVTQATTEYTGDSSEYILCLDFLTNTGQNIRLGYWVLFLAEGQSRYPALAGHFYRCVVPSCSAVKFALIKCHSQLALCEQNTRIIGIIIYCKEY